jgi:hypothetical protein
MESFIQMVENVSKTVDQFMADNISDNQARDWLAARYPEHIRIDKDKAVPVDGSDDRPMPDFRRDLNLPDSISGVDESTIDETLVPAARRRLAESRLQLLSTLVLMGVNRIVVTGGKIRATMGFHIDTTDRLHEEHASDFDFRTATAGSFGYGPWSVSASLSVSYVTSTRQQSDSEINVDTDLTGEVELHFKSDYFPVERFANSGVLGTIQNNTAVPEANRPPQTPTDSLATEAPATGGDVGRYTSSRSRRTPKKEPILPPIGTRSPDSNVPVEPTAPKVKRWQAAPGWEDATPPEGAIVSKPKEEKKEDEKKEEDKKEPAKEEQKVEAKKTKGPDKKKEPAKKQEPKKEEAKNGEATGEAESLSWSPLR